MGESKKMSVKDPTAFILSALRRVAGNEASPYCLQKMPDEADDKQPSIEEQAAVMAAMQMQAWGMTPAPIQMMSTASAVKQLASLPQEGTVAGWGTSYGAAA